MSTTLLQDATEEQLYAALAARGIAVVAACEIDRLAEDHGVAPAIIVEALPRIRNTIWNSSAPESIATVTDNVLQDMGLLPDEDDAEPQP